MKKTVIWFLCMSILLGLCGCGESGGTETEPSQTEPLQTTVPAEPSS